MTMKAVFNWRAHYAVHVLRQHGVLAHPTEAVWGLACNPFSEEAVQRLLDLKGRPEEKGLILISSDPAHFAGLLKPLPTELQQRFHAQQERPTTWIVPDVQEQIPHWVRGKHQGVAVRVSQHPIVHALTSAFQCPIISTSANPAGKPPAMNLADISRYFRGQVDFIVNGRLGGASRPSRIIDLQSGQVLRD
jgi:L-threonylcarbamoyladenylate synthase